MLDYPIQAAPVSLDVPLISNQEVYVNIALIKQYHQNMPRQQAKQMAMEYLQKLEVGDIAYKRNPFLTQEERFCAMLLRAAMVKDAIIIIDQPFKLIPHLKDIGYITTALKKIDDLYLSCHIYDYQWMEEKYGTYNIEPRI